MALDGYKHYKAKQARSTIEVQTYEFTVEPLFCSGCLAAINRVFAQHGIFPVSSEALTYGDRDGDKSGTLRVMVTPDISEESIRQALLDGKKLKESAGSRPRY